MQIVDYNSIVKNAEFFKKKLENSRLCAVLKNDAYGHGLVRTACALSSVADFFAVGSVAEALKVQPFCPNVLILLPLFCEDVETAVEHNFILTVDSFETLDRVIGCTPKGKKARVHLKIESGMNRLGFECSQLQRLAEETDNSKISVEGVFSHFYGETEHSCNIQLKKFNKAADFFAEQNPNLIRHVANTSAVLLGKKYFLDMARIGLGLYGYGAPELIPAKTVTAKVIALRKVRKGEVVSYGGKRLSDDADLAVLNCGYANGFPRALRGACVKIDGKLCPVVGNVCMAMTMVDVSNANVAIGDSAILLGDGVNNANENVIVYEMLCNLH